MKVSVPSAALPGCFAQVSLLVVELDVEMVRE